MKLFGGPSGNTPGGGSPPAYEVGSVEICMFAPTCVAKMPVPEASVPEGATLKLRTKLPLS